MVTRTRRRLLFMHENSIFLNLCNWTWLDSYKKLNFKRSLLCCIWVNFLCWSQKWLFECVFYVWNYIWSYIYNTITYRRDLTVVGGLIIGQGLFTVLMHRMPHRKWREKQATSELITRLWSAWRLLSFSPSPEGMVDSAGQTCCSSKCFQCFVSWRRHVDL